MSAGTAGKVMRDLLGQQLLMQLIVHLVKEIIAAAVEDDGKAARLQQLCLIHHAVVGPSLGEAVETAQSSRDVPVLREGPEIHATAHAAGRAKNILVTEGKEQSSMATHAQSRDGSSCALAIRLIMLIDVIYQLLAYIGFILPVAIHGTVEVPAAEIAIGAYDQYIILAGIFFYSRHLRYPVAVVAAVPMEQVYYGIIPALRIRIGLYYRCLDILMHGSAMGYDRVHVRERIFHSPTHLWKLAHIQLQHTPIHDIRMVDPTLVIRSPI